MPHSKGPVSFFRDTYQFNTGCFAVTSPLLQRPRTTAGISVSDDDSISCRMFCMKIGAIPETLLERIAFALGLVPTPLVDTSAMFILVRTIIVATKLRIFESLASQSRTAEDVAAFCSTDVAATNKLLDALVSSGYLHSTNGCYRLSGISRTWLLESSPVS